MTTPTFDLLCAFETHDASAIAAVLDSGLDIHMPIDGVSPVTKLTEMYRRSDRFPDCLRLMLERGAVLDDPLIAPVLLNDVDALRMAVRASPSLLQHRTAMRSAFTPLVGASLLHVAAEYGNLDVARLLIEFGADVNVPAARDDHGFNGHTPLFHTVNSNANRSEPVMRLLLESGARADVMLAGITWGAGYEWETVCFDVTPVSYAQCGLLRQFQRTEIDTYANISALLRALGRTSPPLSNVPNRYLLT